MIFGHITLPAIAPVSEVWENAAFALHRATAYDAVKHKRLMQRTTIGGDELTVPQ